MSVNLDATYFNAGDRTSSSRDIGDRHPDKKNTKSKTLRLDSPTTIEACKELGIVIEDLRPKVIEDFKDPTVEEEIWQLRFNHYFKRYNQNMVDVMAKKRQINRQRQRQLKLQQQAELGYGESSQNLSKRPFITHVDFSTPQGLKTSFSGQNFLPTPMAASLNKTYAYLRTSHETPETKDLYEMIGNDNVNMDETVEHFDHALAGEIAKFNKLKRQKQKEAKDTFEQEMRRVKTVEEMKAKEKRREEREKKAIVEKKKLREEKLKKAEEKLEKIRDADRRFYEHKLDEKDRMQRKLEETKKKLAEENEEKARQMLEHEQRLEQKRRVAEERRWRLKEEEQMRCDQLKFELENKLSNSIDRHESHMNDKTMRIKAQITKIEDNVKRMKEKQQQDNVDFVQNLVEKLVKKEEDSKAYQNQQTMEMKKKEKEKSDRNKRFFGHQSKLNEQQEDRIHEINERFRKVHENLQAKKEQEEKAMRIRQEETKLRINDKQQNYLKKQRQVQYERQKILDRQKYNQEKLLWLKNQRDILQQAKVEVSIQAKIERDRIEQAIQQLSKLTSEIGVSSTINDQQKRILRDVLRPEDYKEIEDEERRKEEERQEAEEARKNGVSHLPPVVKAR